MASPTVPLVLAVVIVAFILTPFTFLALFLFYKALGQSYEDWSEMRGLGETVGWLALLLLKVGGLSLYGALVYFALRVLF